MIDLYYWPTPNGHKVTILLEGMRAFLHNQAGQYRPRRPTFAVVPQTFAQRADAGHRGSRTDGWRRAHHDFRIRLNHDVSRRKDREILATGAASQI